MTEREFATDVVRSLQQSRFRALWAGGCVRDELLGLQPNDYDVATDARPEQVTKLFRRSIAIGAAFGVIEVIGPRGNDGQHLTVEVATFRSDGVYIDGRRPETVTFSSPEEDAQRRDFTINGMFFDPIAGQLHDYVGGRNDLDAKVLRAIGDPIARFTEDKLRVLRAVRIAARFELRIDPETLAAAKKIAPEIKVVSAERIAEELRKLLTHSNRARGVKLLREFELIPPVLPELVPTFALSQGLPSAPTGTLWEHLVRVMALLQRPNPPTPFPKREGGAEPISPPLLGEGPGEGFHQVSFPLAFAAMLHNVGKQMVEKIADRLKLSTAEKVRVAWLVEKHQYLADAPTMRLSKLKTILVHPGIGELLALHKADALASGHGLEHVDFCERMLREMPVEELNPSPAITGEDLIAIGLEPGRDFKRLLDAVREAQLEGRVRTKQDGLRLAEELRNPPE